MTNAIYPKFKEIIMSTGLNLLTLDVRIILVDTGLYTYSAAHQFLSNVPLGARIGPDSGSLTGKDVTNGIFDADDATFLAVSGSSVEALIIYQHTGADSTSRLITYIDSGVLGLPFTPNGGNVILSFDNGPNKIFVL